MSSPSTSRNMLRSFVTLVLRKRIFILVFGTASVLYTLVQTSKYRALMQLRRKTEEFLQDPLLLSIHCNPGRLGNQMFLYATLYGLAELNHRVPYAPHCNTVHLDPYFKVTMNEIEKLPVNKMREHELISYIRPEDKHISNDKNILGGNAFPTSYTFFHHIREKIRKEFKFKERLNSYADGVLSSLNKHGPSEIYVGVHVRKTDYCGWLANYNGTEVSVEYFLKAMRYFRRKYNPVLFIVVSDDRLWCKDNLAMLPDVVIAPRPPDAAHDLAVLTHCNHTIISYGSFGFWGAYLGRGEVVYFSDYLSPYSSFLQSQMLYNATYLPEWTAISTIKPEFWKTYVPDKPRCYKWFWEQIIDWFRE